MLLFAWFWTRSTGARGFFPLDQSIVMDGAWRIHCGQLPWRDFTTAFGIAPILLQAGIFALFGVSFSSYLLGAALVSVTATLAAVLVVRRLLPATSLLPLVAGFLTAIWFQAPFGTPYAEQTAFLFALLALLLILIVLDLPQERHKKRRLLLFGVGLLLFLAFLAKQNAAILFLPPSLLLLFTEGRKGKRAFLADSFVLVAGFLVAAAVFLLWLGIYAEPAWFFRSYFGIPGETLWPRLLERMPALLTWPLFGRGPPVARVIFLLCLLLSTFVAFRLRKSSRKLFRQALLCLLLVLYQNFFVASSNNSAENAYPFAGIILALALSLALHLIPRTSSRRFFVFLRRSLPVLFVLLLAGRGLQVGWERRVHLVFRAASFAEKLSAKGWEELCWGNPTRIAGTDVKLEDLEALIADLEKREQNFFVFPDFTFLYAVLGRPSPQPLLWFHWGITYAREYDRALDDRIVRDLERNNVKVIVIEEKSWMDSSEQLRHFPILATKIRTQYVEVARYGIFRVLRER